MIRVRLPGMPRDPVTDPKTGWLTQAWVFWLRELATRVNAASPRLQVISLAAQSASIPTTPVPLGELSAGLYRVGYTVRVTRPASVSSSLTVSVHWTSGGAGCSQSFVAVTGNTTSTTQSGNLVLRADRDTSLGYAVAYTSAGAVSAEFSLDVVVEALPEAI